MIPDFKTYIKESLWTDIQRRSAGDTVRDEDKFNPDYVDFGENTTVYWAIDNLEIDGEVKFYFDDVKDYNNNGWRLPTVDEVNQLKWNVRIAWYEGCKHLKFDDEQELRLKTNGSGGFHMWTKEINTKFPSSAYAYGFNNSNDFDVTNFNKSINKLFVFLVKDKRTNESLWTDIQSRSAGETTRKEDDVNLLDRDGFYEYIMKHYKTSTEDITGPYAILNSKNADYINIPIFENDGILYRVIIFDFDKNPYLTIPIREPFWSSNLFVKIRNNFALKKVQWDDISPKFAVWPKGIIKKTELNKFFLEVIDFIIDNVEEPFEPLLKRI